MPEPPRVQCWARRNPHRTAKRRARFGPDERPSLTFALLFLVPGAARAPRLNNSGGGSTSLITLIPTLGKHASPSPRPYTYVLLMSLPLRAVSTMLGAPSCVLGAINAPLEPLTSWLKFPLTPGKKNFFFGFLGNDSL